MNVGVAGVEIGGGRPVLIAGPCVIEEPERVLRIARVLQARCAVRGIDLIFKASFDKANRTSLHSYRGPGLEAGLRVLAAVKAELGLPLTTDVHLPHQAEAVAAVVDLLQVPAFLCRQTDLIAACGATGKPVNLKKGQFATAQQMVHAAEKATAAGAPSVVITERGSSFGHGDLVVDLRQILELKDAGLPVIYDATHSVQRPGGATTGGDRRFVTALARAALAAGADALFAEVHDDPSQARSDAAVQLPLDAVDDFLDATCVALGGAASTGTAKEAP